jgi:hypothetical protein
MKNNILLCCLVLFFLQTNAQYNQSKQLVPDDSLPEDHLYNQYGNLLTDDPAYNRKITWVKPAVLVLSVNAVTWLTDRYLLDVEYSRVSPHTWQNNLKNGPEWDNDKLRINFIGHPYSGTQFFNAARSNGYSYLQSIPFTAGGSIMWEYFGENTRPSYNDMITTTISGAFLGEILYRLSSKVLNDKSQGGTRVLRELCVGIINPVRGFNRLTQGKTWSVTSKEVYQKEPLNVTFFTGIHKVNNGTAFGTGSSNAMFNIQMDYGDPFEQRARKPFDVFRLRVDFTYGSNIGFPNMITGYGLLGGKNFRVGNNVMLIGGFQHYDYWNSKNFQMASIGFGAGMLGKTPIGEKSDFYSSIHLAAVPLAGINPSIGSDTFKYRNYDYGGGVEGKFESTLNLGKYLSISLNAYYYWIHTFASYTNIGNSGNHMLGIIKPKFSIWISRNISAGFEQFFYFTDSSPEERAFVRQTRTEQKIFLQLFLENPRRKGSRYN